MARKQRKYIKNKTYDTIVRMHVVEKQIRVKIAYCLDLLVNAVENAIKNHFDKKEFIPAAIPLKKTAISKNNIMSEIDMSLFNIVEVNNAQV